MQELLICIRDFTAAHLQRSASPATYLPSSPPPPPSCHFSLCSHGPAPPLVPACFKEGSRKAGRQKFSLSKHQLAITPEELANRSTADERQKWDRLLFINMVRGEVCVRVPVSECVRARVFLWGVRNEPQTVSFTQLTNTLILQCPGETEKHRGTADAIILLNKNAKQRREKPAATQETLYLTHIIYCKLIPKNLALLVLTPILDCDSQHFEACPFSSVWERSVSRWRGQNCLRYVYGSFQNSQIHCWPVDPIHTWLKLLHGNKFCKFVSSNRGQFHKVESSF